MFNYRNVYDPSTGFMRGRDELGRWADNFDPAEWGGPFTEGCAWHWQWSVFHDVAGLIDLMGGDQAFVAMLDAVFTQPNQYKVGSYGAPIHEMREMVLAEMGQYAHGNQPIQHMVYLYTYAGQPWKTQQLVRSVMTRLYNSSENGFPGDEDQGQTSAWYVLSALGFYSVCPGTDEYVIGSPLFDKATITQENGNQFIIQANRNCPASPYIQSGRLDGVEYSKSFLRHVDIASGGRLELDMGPTPNVARDVALKDRPFSASMQQVAEPASLRDDMRRGSVEVSRASSHR
jgi:predicted alpha-1,2-mannosidase